MLLTQTVKQKPPFVTHIFPRLYCIHFNVYRCFLFVHLCREFCYQVVDILRTTELYSSHLKEDQTRLGDPVAADLIGALLTVSGIRITRLNFSGKIESMLLVASKDLCRRRQRGGHRMIPHRPGWRWRRRGKRCKCGL